MAAIEYWGRDGFYTVIAIGLKELTDWNNGGVKLALGDLKAIDYFHHALVQHTKPQTIEINPMTATHYPKRLTTGVVEGSLATTHYLQTAIFTYAVMGACTTTEATPNIHAITKGTTEAPIRFAMHFEKEGTTAARRKDCVGFIPRALDITVSEASTVAFQTYNAVFSESIAADDIAQPTPYVQGTHSPYTWFHTKHASAATVFDYNSGAINVDIVDIAMHFGWKGYQFGPYDSDGFPTNGVVVPPFEAWVDLGVRLTDGAGTNLDAIADTKHDSYAGDLDFILDFYESANRYIKYTWDDMYIVPDSYQEVFKEEGNWFDGVRFKLVFRNETSSLAVEEKNSLNNDSYENPA
jgi:hypothetical protein